MAQWGLRHVIAMVVIALAYLPVASACFMLLWNWFVVPVGMRPTSYLNAVGIMLLVSILTNGLGKTADYADDSSPMGGMLPIVIRPLVATVIGFVIVLFVS